MAADLTTPLTGPDDPTVPIPRIRADAPPPPLYVERWSPDGRGWTMRYSAIGAIVTVILILTVALPDIYTNLVAKAAVYGMVAISMNILVGYAGQVSLGHAAFFGTGAFASAYAISNVDLPWVFGLGTAAITGGLAAAALGAVALRVKGLYLALVTIAFGLFAQNTVFNIGSLTGGGSGAIAPRPAFGGTEMSSVSYAYLCIAVLVVLLVLDTLFAGSKAGRAVRALKDDERVAASWGINVTGYKLLAFVLSGMIAAIAGALFASIEGRVAPADFQFSLSITFLLMTVVGGAGNRWGVVQGGILFAVLANLLEAANENLPFPPFSFIDASAEPVIAAALLLVTLTLYPGGIADQQRPLLRWLGGGRFRETEDDPLTNPPVVRREGEDGAVAQAQAQQALAEQEADESTGAVVEPGSAGASDGGART